MLDVDQMAWGEIVVKSRALQIREPWSFGLSLAKLYRKLAAYQTLSYDQSIYGSRKTTQNVLYASHSRISHSSSLYVTRYSIPRTRPKNQNAKLNPMRKSLPRIFQVKGQTKSSASEQFVRISMIHWSIGGKWSRTLGGLLPLKVE